MPKSLFTSWSCLCKSCLHWTWWWRKLCTATEFSRPPLFNTHTHTEQWTGPTVICIYYNHRWLLQLLKTTGAASWDSVRLFQLNTNQTWFQAGLLRTVGPPMSNTETRLTSGSCSWRLRSVSFYVASYRPGTEAATKGSTKAGDLLKFVPVFPMFQTWLLVPNPLLWSIDTYYITTCT